MNTRLLGNYYGLGSGFDGNVFDKNYISPTLTASQAHGSVPKIIEIRKVDSMYETNRIVEQSRAEQSRAEQLNCRKIGLLDTKGFEESQRVYDAEYISPTVKIGGDPIKILEVKKMETNILGNLQPETKHQSQNVYDENGCAPTVMAGTHGYGMGYVKEQQIVAMRGRDKDNPSDRTVGNQNLEQRLEPNTKGTSNTITSVQKDNLLLEKQTVKIREANKKGYAECEIGGVADLNYTSSTTRRGRVQSGGQISPALCAENVPSVIELGDPDFYNFLYEIDGDIYLIRIRKLIPKECLKLMDVPEEYIDRMLQVESNTNLYKAAGNSIVVNCLTAIFGMMFEGKEDYYKRM